MSTNYMNLSQSHNFWFRAITLFYIGVLGLLIYQSPPTHSDIEQRIKTIKTEKLVNHSEPLVSNTQKSAALELMEQSQIAEQTLLKIKLKKINLIWILYASKILFVIILIILFAKRSKILLPVFILWILSVEIIWPFLNVWIYASEGSQIALIAPALFPSQKLRYTEALFNLYGIISIAGKIGILAYIYSCCRGGAGPRPGQQQLQHKSFEPETDIK